VVLLCIRPALLGKGYRRFDGCNCLSGIAGRDDGSRFHHQNDGPIRRARAMDDAFGYDEAFSRLQIDRTVLEIDDEVAFEHEKELVIILVPVPVILALHYAEANHRIIHLAQRLVVPTIGAGLDQSRHIDRGERRKSDIQVCGIRIRFRIWHVASNRP
jgi:hypothetical protein